MPSTIDPNEVEAFLRENPSFLQDRPGLLAALSLPHGGEGAVSLVERQVSVLRERNIASRQRLVELSNIGKENDRLLEATRDTILAMLAAKDRADLSEIWLEHATQTFKTEMGALIWVTANTDYSDQHVMASRLVSPGGNFSGVLRPEEINAIFGVDATEGSATLVAIRIGEDEIGVLGVGSRDTQRYGTEDGTLFLDYLSEVIGQLPASR